LFQLRVHFVLEERIGIGEIGPEQVLTNHLHANERQTPRAGDPAVSSTCSATDSISFSKNEPEASQSVGRIS
jgi:hypothetical protein